MPSRRFPPSRGHARTNRRANIWATQDLTPNLAIAPQQQSFDMVGNVLAGLGSVMGATLVRIYLEVTADWTAAAVGDSFTIGIAVGRRSLDVGTPTPAGGMTTTDAGQNWMYLRKNHPVTAGGGFGQEKYIVNIASMRKLRDLDDTPILCLRHDVGAAALQTRVFGRYLLRLP